MKFTEAFSLIPRVPLSALVMYIGLLLMIKISLVPSIPEMFLFMNYLFNSFGYFGLFVASFLEGIVYMGLYFPGSFVVLLAVLFSDGSFISFIKISVVVAIALTLTSCINYGLGRLVRLIHPTKKNSPQLQHGNSGLVLSIFHPAVLAFYFFYAGMREERVFKIALVPLLLTIYGTVLAGFLYVFGSTIEAAVSNQYQLLLMIMIWVIIAFILNVKRS
ncbi:MAG: membrane-associated protein [Patescibacteria group bacterium]|jgi:membrane-associated protein